MNRPKKTWHAKALAPPKQETKLSGTGTQASLHDAVYETRLSISYHHHH